MKDFFSNKLCTSDDNLDEAHEKNHTNLTPNGAIQYCPNCMTRRGCPCNDCTVTHMISCEGYIFFFFILISIIIIIMFYEKVIIKLNFRYIVGYRIAFRE